MGTTVTKKRASGRQRLLKEGVDFHGHLGPYLVFGLRMGVIAIQRLKPKRLHELSATVWTRKSPPESCMLDGIQVSSGCTLGKGNIIVKESQRIKVRFRKGNRVILIGPTEKTAALLSRVSASSPQREVQEIALALHRMPNHELFTVE